jgi:L-aspartate oxidase
LPGAFLTRAICRRRAGGHRVFLDARAAIGARFETRFPSIWAACRKAGLDPAREPIPVRPAQHYHMGGVAVDGEGLSSVDGLWACGEAASTGLHGANRLASNALSEAAVFGAIVARSIEGAPTRALKRLSAFLPPPPADPSVVRPILSRAAGVMRDGEKLRAAIGPLASLARSSPSAADASAVALMIVVAALARDHSVGAHCRLDFPERPAAPLRSRITLDQAFAAAGAIASDPLASRG